jgi:glycosyltransferase involved in cell wall biosynthesis
LALNEVIKEFPNTKLLIAGNGNDKNYPNELRKLTYKLGINNNVIFLSHVDNIHCILKDIDVLIHPSVLEGWCLVKYCINKR